MRYSCVSPPRVCFHRGSQFQLFLPFIPMFISIFLSNSLIIYIYWFINIGYFLLILCYVGWGFLSHLPTYFPFLLPVFKNSYLKIFRSVNSTYYIYIAIFLYWAKQDTMLLDLFGFLLYTKICLKMPHVFFASLSLSLHAHLTFFWTAHAPSQTASHVFFRRSSQSACPPEWVQPAAPITLEPPLFSYLEPRCFIRWYC